MSDALPASGDVRDRRRTSCAEPGRRQRQPSGDTVCRTTLLALARGVARSRPALRERCAQPRRATPRRREPARSAAGARRYARFAGAARRRRRRRSRRRSCMRCPAGRRALRAAHRQGLPGSRRRCWKASARRRRCGRCMPNDHGHGNSEGLRRLLLAIVRDLRVVPMLLARQLARMRAGRKRCRKTSAARWRSSRATSTRRSPTASASGS